MVMVFKHAVLLFLMASYTTKKLFWKTLVKVLPQSYPILMRLAPLTVDLLVFCLICVYRKLQHL